MAEQFTLGVSTQILSAATIFRKPEPRPSFLKAHDVPNWAFLVVWLMAYMYSVAGEKLERVREKYWAYRNSHGADRRSKEGDKR